MGPPFCALSTILLCGGQGAEEGRGEQALSRFPGTVGSLPGAEGPGSTVWAGCPFSLHAVIVPPEVAVAHGSAEPGMVTTGLNLGDKGEGMSSAATQR